MTPWIARRYSKIYPRSILFPFISVFFFSLMCCSILRTWFKYKGPHSRRWLFAHTLDSLLAEVYVNHKVIPRRSVISPGFNSLRSCSSNRCDWRDTQGQMHWIRTRTRSGGCHTYKAFFHPTNPNDNTTILRWTMY